MGFRALVESKKEVTGEPGRSKRSPISEGGTGPLEKLHPPGSPGPTLSQSERGPIGPKAQRVQKRKRTVFRTYRVARAVLFPPEVLRPVMSEQGPPAALVDGHRLRALAQVCSERLNAMEAEVLVFRPMSAHQSSALTQQQCFRKCGMH